MEILVFILHLIISPRFSGKIMLSMESVYETVILLKDVTNFASFKF